ncbi:hypothetical protein ACFV2B_16050 [Streptomyces lavendulae]|uniref:hypothetical protein n=1 Tax=Streptomyces lavendulae TaxID=1914 RepID=UPI00368EF57D
MPVLGLRQRVVPSRVTRTTPESPRFTYPLLPPGDAPGTQVNSDDLLRRFSRFCLVGHDAHQDAVHDGVCVGDRCGYRQGPELFAVLQCVGLDVVVGQDDFVVVDAEVLRSPWMCHFSLPSVVERAEMMLPKLTVDILFLPLYPVGSRR